MSQCFLISARLIALLSVLFGFAAPLRANTSHSHVAAICDSAAVLAARESGVPLDVLRAISLTETGRRNDGEFLPWPWTVNMEGVGKWFDTVGDAQIYVDRHFARGARSFDVGCFQINYKWHGKAFSSIEEMFDPIANARYAAKFLTELHQEMGDWSKAAGAYHSRTPKYAGRYAARFARIRSNLPEARPAAELQIEPTDFVEIRPNGYPLLQSGQILGAASLVPLRNQGSSRFIDIATARPIIGAP